MWQRTITIGSVGKSLSLTGWKIGWVYGPENLLFNLKMVHQYCVDSIHAPLQVHFLWLIFQVHHENKFSSIGSNCNYIREGTETPRIAILLFQ